MFLELVKDNNLLIQDIQSTPSRYIWWGRPTLENIIVQLQKIKNKGIHRKGNLKGVTVRL
jgi:hypothetical protein